jgi:hypothetical protein
VILSIVVEYEVVFDEGMILFVTGGACMLVGRSVEVSEASRRTSVISKIASAEGEARGPRPHFN